MSVNQVSLPELVLPDRTPVPRSIVEHIQRLILKGGLKAGDRLPSQRELAEQLGVSRPSLREALTVLETMGLLTVRAGSGVFVARPDTRAGFVLDGFPRTLPQADALSHILAQQHRQLTSVLYINVADQEIVTRLGGRRICSSCQASYHLTFKPPAEVGICNVCGGELEKRDDDNPDTIRARLKTFHAQTAPLIQYFRAAGLLIEIDGRGEVAAVKQRTVVAARSLLQV